MAQISGQVAGVENSVADMRLMRYRMAGPDPDVALRNALGESPASLETLEQAHAAKRAPIDPVRVIPLVHVSESYGQSLRVRDWMPPRWGGWRIEDVWLEPASPAGGISH